MAFTFFFRDQSMLNMIIAHALPELKKYRYIRIWDAGCAAGQEAYSLAIMLRQNMGPFMFRNVKICASDHDAESGKFGDVVRDGIYSYDDVARIDSAIIDKFFDVIEDKKTYQVKPEIRAAVEFQKHDLLSFNSIACGFNLVLCKNVLLHFHNEERENVIKMFHESMADNSYFAVEQTQELPGGVRHLFDPVVHDRSLFLRKGIN